MTQDGSRTRSLTSPRRRRGGPRTPVPTATHADPDAHSRSRQRRRKGTSRRVTGGRKPHILVSYTAVDQLPNPANKNGLQRMYNDGRTAHTDRDTRRAGSRASRASLLCTAAPLTSAISETHRSCQRPDMGKSRGLCENPAYACTTLCATATQVPARNMRINARCAKPHGIKSAFHIHVS